MDKKELIKFEGSLSIEDVVEALAKANSYSAKTLPELFERLVKCNRCPLEEKCDKLAAGLEENGYSPYCTELLSIMLGDKQISDFI